MDYKLKTFEVTKDETLQLDGWRVVAVLESRIIPSTKTTATKFLVYALVEAC